MSANIVNTWEELLDESVEEPRYKEVEIGTRVVRMASVPSTEVLAFIDEQNSDSGRSGSTLRLIARCIVDKDGHRIGKLDEVEKLAKKSPPTLVKLRDAALEVNGLKVKAGDEPTKNDSGEVASSDSATASPSTSSDQT